MDIYNDVSPELVAEKAGQMGLSEYGISGALWSADVHQATPLYIFPTDTHVSDFSAARLGPAIEASPYLQRIVVSSRADGRRGADRVQLKRIRDRFLYMRGGQVSPDGRAPQLKAIDADAVVFDELDEIDPRAPEIALKRLGHSALGWVRWFSTPSYTGVGIDAKYQQSDGRVWHVRCAACGNRQDLAVGDLVVEWDELQRPVAWHGQTLEQRADPLDENLPGPAWLACRRCGRPLDRLGQGEWVARHPGRLLRGYHVTGLVGAHKSLLQIVRNLQTTNETKRKEAFNQDLGLPHKPTGQQITDDVLDACRRDYGLGPRPGPCFAGVDVGKLLHVVVRGAVDAETGERPARFIGAVASFEELGQLFRLYGVVRAVIDALPETRKVRELHDEFAGMVWLAYYTDGEKSLPRQWEEKPDGESGDVVRTVTLARTPTLDEMFGLVVEAAQAGGGLTLPANARDVAEYYAHLKAPVRVVERGRRGNLVARYVETGPDHYAHAENYCLAAMGGPGGVRPLPHLGGLVARRQRM